jgi:hypothetical protein
MPPSSRSLSYFQKKIEEVWLMMVAAITTWIQHSSSDRKESTRKKVGR